MFSSLKSKNKRNFFSRKRLALIALAVVLVLGCSARVSLAVTYNTNQIYDLKTTFGLKDDQISKLQSSNTTFDAFTQAVNKELDSTGYTDRTSLKSIQAAANTVYNKEIDPDSIDATGLQTTNPDVGLKSALKGLSFVLSESVLATIVGVLGVIVNFCKYFVTFSAQVLDFTLNPALYNFTSRAIVVQGWTVVCDVCNLLFLLVLLFIAICTILKIEKYHAKKTLLMLIIMALLINFSKPIAVFVFDGSQLLMNFFLSQIGKTGTGNESSATLITESSKIANLIYEGLPGYWESSQSSLNIAVQYLFATVFLFMLAVAYFVTAIMMIIRIVAVMMLIIVSPFAFFAAIIPDFSKMSSQWWSSLFEYSYYGPAAAFFLLLATQLSNSLPHLTDSTVKSYTFDNLATTTNNIIHYLTVLVFLYASIFMAKKFGGGVGAAVVGNANKFMRWGSGFYKGGGMWGGLARVTTVAPRYRGLKAGLAERPGWRYLTKEGREKAAKEMEEKTKGKIAPFSMAAERKAAKDEENKDQAKVDAGVLKGSAKDILISSKRGTLTDEQIASAAFLKTISQSKEMRKEVLGNLKDKGNTHLAAYLRYKTRGMEDEPKAGKEDLRTAPLEDFGKNEINDNKKLADMNWEKVMESQLKDDNGKQVNFKEFLVTRMKTLAATDPRKFLNTISSLDGARMNIVVNDPDFKTTIKDARIATGVGRRSETEGYRSGYEA